MVQGAGPLCRRPVHGGRPPTTANARGGGPVRLTYLLDTNVVIALLRNKPAIVRERFRGVVSEGGLIIMSSVVLFELWHGVARSGRREENTERLRVFLSGVSSVLPFGESDASIAGDLRAALEMRGKAIGPYDLLIARGAPVRRDARHCRRIGICSGDRTRLAGLDRRRMIFGARRLSTLCPGWPSARQA